VGVRCANYRASRAAKWRARSSTYRSSAALASGARGFSIFVRGTNRFGDGLNNPSLWRISDPDSVSPKTRVYATLPTTPDGTEAFAPNGTQYVTLGNGGLAQVSATSQPSPATVSVVPSFTIGGLGLLANGTQSDGAAQTVIGNFAGNGNVPGGVGIFDLSTSPPSLTTTLLTDNSAVVGLIQGPDGCIYGSQGDAVFKITDNSGACNYASQTQPAMLTLTPTGTSLTDSQGSAQTFTAGFHYVTVPAGTPVRLNVIGANLQSLLGRTNSSGQATFTYGTFTGTDIVAATATLGSQQLISNTTQATWNSGIQSTFLTLNSSARVGLN
jgi:hypothetical protein